MKKTIKKIKLLFLFIFLFSYVNQVTVKANIPYKSYTQDGYGNYVETQSAYRPVGTITKIGELEFSEASDIKITKDGTLYIADTGNQRILVSDLEGNLIRVIGEGVLSLPKGIFVSEDKTLYVADEKKERIFVFSEKGEQIKDYGRPNHPLFGTDSPFQPQKVVVDKRGNLYIISKGNTNGIIQISPSDDGTFLGYFGVNDTRVDFMTLFRKAIFTEEQKAKMKRSEPVSAANLAIDEQGLIYTVSQGEGQRTLKKMNMAGRNIIHPDVFDRHPSSVTTGPIENIFVASKNGFIYEYNREGSLLFVFGGRDDGRQRVGLFKTVSGIALDDENQLYVLDEEKNEIQIFETTEFADLVHNALVLYQSGHYARSKEPWQEVLSMNSLFDYANLGMGEALFNEEQYEEALGSYRMAKYKNGYSDAYWEIRNTWMRENIIAMILIVIGIFLLIKGIKGLHKKYEILQPCVKIKEWLYQKKLYQELKFLWYFLKNPADAFYGIKFENKTSYLSATILWFIYCVIYLFEKYASGFIFRRVQEGRFTIFTDITYLFGIFALGIICNYAVTTIQDGEAKFKHVYCGAIYSFAPFFLIKPVVIVVSNFLTYNEIFLIDFSNFILMAWVVILLVLMIKYLNDYTMKETFTVIFFTLFTVFIAILVLFIVYVLISQVADFVTSIFGEVLYRVEHRL